VGLVFINFYILSSKITILTFSAASMKSLDETTQCGAQVGSSAP